MSSAAASRVGSAAPAGDLLAAALAALPHGAIVYDADSRLVAANALAAEYCGLPPEAFRPGLPLVEVLAAQARAGLFGTAPLAADTVARLVALDRRLAQSWQRTTLAGQVLEVRTAPMQGGGFVVTFTDITALVTAEAAAEQRAATLRLALDNMRHGLTLWGPDRRLVIANRLASETHGLPDLQSRTGLPFETVIREQAALGLFGSGAAAEAEVERLLALDRSQSLMYRRRLPNGRVIEIGSDPTSDGGFVLTHTDVTPIEEARAEAAARAGILQVMLEGTRHGIALFGPDQRLVTANALAAELHGLPPERLRPGVSGDELAALIVAAGIVTAEDAAATRAVDRSRPHRSLRILPNGRRIAVATDPTPDGGFVATYTDVTALTAAEAAARERADTLDVMLENTRHGICYYGPDRRVIAANALAVELGGYPEGTVLIGRSLQELVMVQLAARAVGGDAAATARHALGLDRRQPARYLRPHRDGRMIEVTSDPTPNGGFVVTMTDISALVAAEAAAQQRAELLQAMLDNIRHGIALFDAAGRVLAVNAVFLALLDLPAALMAPGQPYTAFVDHLAARGEYGEGAAGQAVADAIKARDRSTVVHNVRTRPNGRVVDILSQPIRGGDGWVLTYTDVTDDRRIRAELEQAKDAAEAANRAKSRFLATMTHELRTPLNAVIGFSEALTADPDPQRGADYARSILEAGRHLLSLIDDILDVARAETTGFAISEEEVDLLPIAELSLRVLRSTAGTAGVRLVADLPPSLPLVRGDEMRLRQVLLNLLSNAVKFTPEGGSVTLAAAVEPGGDLVLRVADTGIGIRPEDIPTVFEPFTQVDSSIARRFAGSGLGLYLSRALAEAQGASLTLDSAVGQGTTAILRFPAARLLPAPA